MVGFSTLVRGTEPEPPVLYSWINAFFSTMSGGLDDWHMALLNCMLQPFLLASKGASLRALSVKATMLLALTTAKRLGETALSIYPCYLLLRSDCSGAVLQTNPSFIPKNLFLGRTSSFRSRVIRQDAFCPSPSEPRKARLHLLGSVHTLACYVKFTAIRHTEQLIVCCGDGVS